MKDELTFLTVLEAQKQFGIQLDMFTNRRNVVWFSCGAASAVAGMIALKNNPETQFVYCDTGSEHEDNKRFLADCEKWYGKKIHIIKSDKFYSVDDVIEARNYMSGIDGAPCTIELKKVPRLNYQIPDDIHYYGYTIEEWKRARNFIINNPELLLQFPFPLLYNLLTKEDCLAILKKAGIKLPIMYELGFEHNNCIGCVKSSSPRYWAMIKKYFPIVFWKRVEQSRKLGVKLLKIKNERFYLDELPEGIDWPEEKEAGCDFLCQSIVKQL